MNDIKSSTNAMITAGLLIELRMRGSSWGFLDYNYTYIIVTVHIYERQKHVRVCFFSLWYILHAKFMLLRSIVHH